MRFLNYLKDKIVSIIIYIITSIIICLILRAFKLNNDVTLIIFLILSINGLSILLLNYFRKRNYYNNLLNMLNKLDKKYLVLETIPEPTTYEEILTNDILYEINKSMIENINLQTKGITEFKEFVEIWIHEIKIPISSMVLKCHNHKQINSMDFLSIIRKLDNNIDQILYYMRSEITEKDFIIGKFCLKEIVRNVSLKNKDDLLENQIKLEVNIDNLNVYTDKKWLEFILNQIVNNSIKYKKNNNSIITITAHEEKDKIILSVYDNGIGIPSKNIKRVFDKSFTGTNGRDKVKSTGMGLYIIKNLCNKLGHNIYIKSEENKYTNVVIEFGKNKYYKF